MSRAAVVALMLVSATAAAAPATPHASWTQPALSNGFAAAVYDASAGRLRDLFPHPYAQATAAETTPDMLWDAFFGYATGKAGVWLTSVPPLTVGYESGTGVLAAVRETGGLRFTERWFAPMGAEAPAVVAVVTVRNLGPSAVPALRVFSLHNFHVGAGVPEAGSAGEEIAWEPATSTFRERGVASGRVALAAALGPPSHHASSPPNPYAVVQAAGTLSDTGGSAPADDAVSAFEWAVDGLAPGEEMSFGVVLAVAEPGQAEGLAPAIAPILAAGGPDAVLAAERAWWAAFHQADGLPDALAGDALALSRQALATLAMAQVREPDAGGLTPHGQLLASLPPGQWNRTWVRDQAYATVALAAAGHVEEAAAAIRFVLHGRTGTYAAQVGRPYGVSVCRYLGGGDEESDWNDHGPNIEFDGFGLFLWAVAEVASRRDGFAVEAWPAARDGAADVLVSLLEPGGLVRPDSSIWEHHWDGQQKHYAYTDATAVLGLCAAGALADRAGQDGGPYREAARRVAAAIAGQLVSGGILAQDLEELATGKALDAAVVEAFGWGVLDPAGAVAASTFDAILAGLAVPTGHGLARNDDGDWYDRQEWVFVDLRTANALRRAGRAADAVALADWVLAQSLANFGLVAELYASDTADYAGAVPMGGFGAGSWLLWVLDHRPAVDIDACLAPVQPVEPGAEASPEPAPEPVPDLVEETAPESAPDVAVSPDAADAPPPSDVAATPAPPSGGGCAGGPSATASPLALLALLVLLTAESSLIRAGNALTPRT